MPEETQGPHFLPVLAVSGVGLLLSIYILILCVCGKNKEKKEGNTEETAQLRNGTDSQVNSIAINVDDSVTVLQGPTANGNNRYSGGSPKGGSSPHPPGTNHRELPQPPTSSRNTIGGRANPFQGDARNKRNTIGEAGLTEDQDDYDHLMRQGFQKNNLRRSNYDHIQLGEDGQFHVQARKSDAPATEEMPENDYAEVERENIYEGVKDKQPETETKVQAPASSLVKKPYDPYSSVNDEEDDSGDLEPEKKPYDPYSKLKGDSNSGSFKKKTENEENVRASSKVKKKEYDPYSSVKDGDSNSGSFTAKPYDPYARVKDDKDESSGGTFKDIDPYSTVKEERTPRGKGKDDPYTKVKDMARNDSSVDDNEDPYNKVVDDPYNKVKGDDPYNKVKGDDPYNKVKEDDPYNTVKGDDPYNKVKDEEPEDPYNSVDEDEGSPEGAEGQTHDRPTSYQYSTVNKVNQELKGEGFSVVGEYAQVIKNKDSEANANRPLPTPAANLTNRETDPYQLPPEPPRRYQEDYSEEGSQSGMSHSTNNHPTVMTGGATGGATGGNEATAGTVAPAATNNSGSIATEPTKRKEPPYHKLTARESMASINARRALNTYEEVPDKENMYATVEGGSGDGVVTSRGAAQNSLRPIRQELYEEIPNGDQLPAPAPPSLDTLHLMTEGKSRLSGDTDGSNRSSYSESQKSPGGTTSPRYSTGSTEAVSTGMVNPAFDGDPDSMGISLDPNYTTVRDCIPDRQVEGDPNYESVEEVKSKVQEVEEEKQRQAMRERKKRLHVYEEVREGETNPVKERVLRGHMYEDLDGVKTQKQQLSKKEEDSNDSDVWKRRSDVFSEKL
ncbi:dentin sialophosphoprotein-like [Saccostrea echinata]|uniref:dentin sialophosphoprotein-like n=1 Tax=Saccostrea echinata TaxID=191078 RepID=UPI002A819FE4|nr:dentin sialophosphoprotein-like [Saccostrea echinata]